MSGRVGGANHEATLAGRGQDDEEVAGGLEGLPFVAPDRDGAAAAHFVAECFFLTQRALHNLLMPAGAAASFPPGCTSGIQGALRVHSMSRYLT